MFKIVQVNKYCVHHLSTPKVGTFSLASTSNFKAIVRKPGSSKELFLLNLLRLN